MARKQTKPWRSEQLQQLVPELWNVLRSDDGGWLWLSQIVTINVGLMVMDEYGTAPTRYRAGVDYLGVEVWRTNKYKTMKGAKVAAVEMALEARREALKSMKVESARTIAELVRQEQEVRAQIKGVKGC